MSRSLLQMRTLYQRFSQESMTTNKALRTWACTACTEDGTGPNRLRGRFTSKNCDMYSEPSSPDVLSADEWPGEGVVGEGWGLAFISGCALFFESSTLFPLSFPTAGDEGTSCNCFFGVLLLPPPPILAPCQGLPRDRSRALTQNRNSSPKTSIKYCGGVKTAPQSQCNTCLHPNPASREAGGGRGGKDLPRRLCSW